MRLARLLTAAAGAGILSVLSCAVPFIEPAKDPPGFSVCVGAQATAMAVPAILFDEEGDEHIQTVAPFLFVRQTIGEHFSVAAKGSYGLGFSDGWPGYPTRPHVKYADLSLRFSGKYHVSKRGALKLDFGWPKPAFIGWLPICELSYLHDFSRLFTGSVWGGIPSVIGIGVNFHPDLSDRLTLHIAAGAANVTGAGAGLGLEWHRPYEE